MSQSDFYKKKAAFVRDVWEWWCLASVDLENANDTYWSAPVWMASVVVVSGEEWLNRVFTVKREPFIRGTTDI